MHIIDSHCHVGIRDGTSGLMDSGKLFRKYLIRSKEAGIARTNLFATFHPDYNIANRQVAEIINHNPERFFGFAFIHAVLDRGRVYQMVSQAVREYNFSGMKVHRRDAPITREICQVAASFNLPVIYDILGNTSDLELLATEYPNVNFIIPHLGSFADNWRAQMAFIPYLVHYENIYTDTSGVRIFDMLLAAYKKAGASKILFGTDGPWLHPKVELEKVKALKLNQNEFRKVTSGNFLYLIAKAGLGNLDQKNFGYQK